MASVDAIGDRLAHAMVAQHEGVQVVPREEALGEALQFAARAAAITCSRRGADLPRRAELG